MKLEWPTDRIDYVPITGRPPLPLPGGAKVVVWPCVNVENWVIDQPMPRKLLTAPHGAESVPDIPNFSWVEYGLRAGMPRLFALFAERGIPVSAFINANVCDDYPRLAERVGEAGWEIVGHGLTQRSLQAEGAREVEVIEQSLEQGRPPYTLEWVPSKNHSQRKEDQP